MSSPVSVYKFEYELGKDLNLWNVYIGAFDQTQALEHLQKTVNQPIRVVSSTMVCRVDDLSKEVRENVVKAFNINNQSNENIHSEKIDNSKQTRTRQMKIRGNKK
jgi:hypothetical protein